MWVNEKLCSEAGQYRLCRRPDEGRDPLLRFSKFSGNGDVVQIFIRSGRGSLDPGRPPG
jgi:hypothetical protein